MNDFFISYNKADRKWAEWIEAVLESAGFSVVMQASDFHPGSNFVIEMHQAVHRDARPQKKKRSGVSSTPWVRVSDL